MPVAINSPARNFFLIASSGQQEVTSFITRTQTSSLSDTYGYEPEKVDFVISDQKYLLAGSQLDSLDSLYEGFLEKANEQGVKTFSKKIQYTESSPNYGVTIRSFVQDSNENIIICGRKGQRIPDASGSPYVGKFDIDGINLWYASTSETSDNAFVEYTGVTTDTSDYIYVIGHDPSVNENNSILTKYSPDGVIVWTKKLFDNGSNGFSDFKFRTITINSKDELIVTGSLAGITRTKGIVSKYDTLGNQIWMKTFEDGELATNGSYRNVVINSSYVDSNDYIYCVGYSEDQVSGEYVGIVFRLSPQGNILWQNKTNYSNDIQYTSVSADDLTGQCVVAGDVWTGSSGFTVVQRFSSSGTLVWTRKISSSNNRSAHVNITSDPSYYYIIYADETQQASDPKTFLYGRLSITGNGLGAFAYNDGTLDQNYTVVNVPIVTGTLFDGSIRNDNSDFITYPYSGTKVLFDDLTFIYQPKLPVHDGSDHNIVSQNYSYTEEAPKISSDAIVYDTNLILNYDFGNKATYSGTGTTVKNLSSSSYTGTLQNSGVSFNSAGYFDFDGVNGYIDTGLNAGSVTELTVEAWLRVDTYTNDGAGISIGDTATSTGQCYLGRGNSGGDSIDWRFYTGTYLDETEFFTSDTGWKHYIGTYDQSGGAGSNQGRMILYVDGVQQDVALSNNTSAINFSGGTNIRIGTNTNSGTTSFFDGKFGEVRIYNRALDSTEVSQNFNATRAKYGV